MISARRAARERHGVLSRAGASSLYDPCVLRALLIVTCLVGCKKKEREMATELPPTPSTGHSITHFKDASEPGGEESASGSFASASAAPMSRRRRSAENRRIAIPTATFTVQAGR